MAELRKYPVGYAIETGYIVVHEDGPDEPEQGLPRIVGNRWFLSRELAAAYGYEKWYMKLYRPESEVGEAEIKQLAETGYLDGGWWRLRIVTVNLAVAEKQDFDSAEISAKEG